MKMSMTPGLLHLVLLVISIYVENVTSTCPVGNEILNKTCDWSSWLPWNCSSCKNQNDKILFAVRKRAICCEKGIQLSACLKLCNYSADSDTSYGNCTDSCVSDQKTATGNQDMVASTSMTATLESSVKVSDGNASSPITTPAPMTSKSKDYFSNTSVSNEKNTLTAAKGANSSHETSNEQKNVTGNGHSSIGLILGVVAGCVAFLLIVACFIIWLKRKKFKSPVEPEPENAESPPEENKTITASESN